MKTWTGFSLAWVVAVAVSASACSDDGLAPEAEGSEGSTTGLTTSNGMTSMLPDTSDGGSTSADESDSATSDSATTGPVSDGTSTGGTTDGGSSSEGGSSSGGSSSGGMTNPYEGSYDGTWMGMCLGLPLNGTLTFDVAGDGSLMGSFAGSDNGPMSGTVDGTGLIAANGTGMIAGMCDFDGQIDMMGGVTGTWTCPGLGCMGPWVAQEI